ncbi:hypothetical protein [Streptomyces sp. NPDC058304]|uniref:hypothetical protein n=1 Tax=Streptomyces sp. NPDC058304 TaxID=3346437 RepID=UPI0036E53F8D
MTLASRKSSGRTPPVTVPDHALVHRRAHREDAVFVPARGEGRPQHVCVEQSTRLVEVVPDEPPGGPRMRVVGHLAGGEDDPHPHLGAVRGEQVVLVEEFGSGGEQ